MKHKPSSCPAVLSLGFAWQCVVLETARALEPGRLGFKSKVRFSYESLGKLNALSAYIYLGPLFSLEERERD